MHDRSSGGVPSTLVATRAVLAACALAGALVPRSADAADLTILGRVMYVHTSQSSTHRTGQVSVTARESATDVAPLLDPRADGATLAVVLDGPYPSAQSFTLEPSGWTATAKGYRYKKPRGAGGHPVDSVTITAQPGGTAMLRVIIKDRIGTDGLGVWPPGPDGSGGIVLTMQNQRYCVRLGGPAGGVLRTVTSTSWRMVNATAEAGCLEPPPQPQCGDGVVEGFESCDGDASTCDERYTSSVTCGAPGNALHACSCCYPTGAKYITLLTPSGSCCDNNDFPLAPNQVYCGSCLPDGELCLQGPQFCCGGGCSGPPGPQSVCRSCTAAGGACSPAEPQSCCSLSCSAGGTCD